MTAFYVKYFYGLHHGLHVLNWVTKCVDADCLIFFFFSSNQVFEITFDNVITLCHFYSPITLLSWFIYIIDYKCNSEGYRR